MDDNYDLANLPEEPVTSCSRLGVNNDGPVPEAATARSDFDPAQWTVLGPGAFVPSGRSYKKLPAGFYRAQILHDGTVYAAEVPLVSDKLTVLDGTCNESVLSGIRTFWKSREKYDHHGLNYKRGILFYGPPGSGKSATITLLCKELIQTYGGAVFVCENPLTLAMLLHKLRKIEPNRPLIVIMEDIDEIIHRYSEHDLLALLDGEIQISNVVFVASTNYPDRLGGRIVNRPSRFDERIQVGMPSMETRLAYLKEVTKQYAAEFDLFEWAYDTEGMSISHLRELVVAVCCLGRDYAETLARLKSMRAAPKTKEGLGRQIGISAA